VTSLLTALGLVAYNNVLNLWPPFHRWAYVPFNLATTGAIVLGAVKLSDLSPAGLGFAKPETAVLGLGGGLLAAAPLVAVLGVPRWRSYVADRRFTGDSNAMTAFRMFVRVPFGTALLEETAFRGVLLAFSMPYGRLAAAVISSAAFGLWHIIPTSNTVRINRPGISARDLTAAILGGVLFTTAAGFGLAWLRIQTDSLAAPFALHTTLNALATLATTIAARSPAGIVEKT
jgi:membrane protease YdiL (CAAX protease family)